MQQIRPYVREQPDLADSRRRPFHSSAETLKNVAGISGPRPEKKINLALQGGGAHGAFTWGVIDHLLEDGRIHIAGVSGTSAGAMNAVMLADGLARGGGEEARKRLAEFWRAASIGGNLPGPQRAVLDRMLALMPVEASPVPLHGRHHVARALALRSQSAQHQSAQRT